MRRVVGLYLVVFFSAISAASHRHINDLEDLLLDQPSDSGVVVVTPPLVAIQDRPVFNAPRVVDDGPCLACFGSDFVSAPSHLVEFIVDFDRLPLRTKATSEAEPAPLPLKRSSRSPPSLS